MSGDGKCHGGTIARRSLEADICNPPFSVTVYLLPFPSFRLDIDEIPERHTRFRTVIKVGSPAIS